MCGLGSAWKQGHVLNNLRSLDLDFAATSETKISGEHVSAPVFKDYIVFSSCGLSGVGGGVAVLLLKSKDLQVWAIFLDLDGMVIVLDVNITKVAPLGKWRFMLQQGLESRVS